MLTATRMVMVPSASPALPLKHVPLFFREEAARLESLLSGCSLSLLLASDLRRLSDVLYTQKRPNHGEAITY